MQADDCTIVPNISAFQHFVRQRRSEMTLLGVLVVQGKVQVEAITHKTEELN